MEDAPHLHHVLNNFGFCCLSKNPWEGSAGEHVLDSPLICRTNNGIICLAGQPQKIRTLFHGRLNHHSRPCRQWWLNIILQGPLGKLVECPTADMTQERHEWGVVSLHNSTVVTVITGFVTTTGVQPWGFYHGEVLIKQWQWSGGRSSCGRRSSCHSGGGSRRPRPPLPFEKRRKPDNPPPCGASENNKTSGSFSSSGGGRGSRSKGRGFILTKAISCNSRVPCMQAFSPPFFRRSSTTHWSVSGPGGKCRAEDSSVWCHMLACGSGRL